MGIRAGLVESVARDTVCIVCGVWGVTSGAVMAMHHNASASGPAYSLCMTVIHRKKSETLGPYRLWNVFQYIASQKVMGLLFLSCFLDENIPTTT